MVSDAWKDFCKTESKDFVKEANKIRPKILPLYDKEIERLFNQFKE